MNQNRWKMNKLGFVNFWLYDNQEFPLSNGKILLRGQNASGKSITTQSFIPFILDGDRTPSRLDPFGSSDRRMDYYFLGETDQNDVTGYLYLEFYKKETNQYKTIGIGQRARRGMQGLGFWGFILSDGRRIGQDVQLYQQYGQDFIPLDKKQCKEVIGEHNFFTESPREYKEKVGKDVFGFQDVSTYDQFIKLLIKVRAPKLSKEFKPSKVYDILNDSLQTLNDDDISAFVESMQKMDEIQLQLEEYKRTAYELKFITKEYEQYNKYILGKKAEQWKNVKNECDEKHRVLNQIEKEIKNLKKRIEKDVNTKDELMKQKTHLQAKMDEFATKGLENQIEKKHNLIQEKERKETSLQSYKEKIMDIRADLTVMDRELKNNESNLESFENDSLSILDDLNQLNVSICFQGHSDVKNLKENLKNRVFYSSILNELHELEKDVVSIIQAWNEFHRLEKEYSTCLEQLEKIKKECESIQNQIQSTLKQFEDEKDTLIDAYYHSAQINQEFVFDEEELKAFVVYVKEYETREDGQVIHDFVNQCFYKRQNLLQKKLAQIEYNVEQYRDKIKELENEQETLKNTKEIPPVRSEYVLQTRQKLKENGIEAMPFYEAIEFKENISLQEQLRMEAQLEQAGLLDALVLPFSKKEEAKAILKNESDCILDVPSCDTTPFYAFTIASSISNPDLKKEVNLILRAISKDKGIFVLGEDGYFKNGIVEGYLHHFEKDSLQFIGKEARKNAIVRKIQQLQDQINELNIALDIEKEKRNHVHQSLHLLKEEMRQLPQLNGMYAYLNDLESLGLKEKQVVQTQNIKEKECQQKEYLLQQIRVQNQNAMKKYTYNYRLDAYEQVLEDIQEYKEQLNLYMNGLYAIQNVEEKNSHLKSRMLDKENSLDDIQFTCKNTENEIETIYVQIQWIENLLNEDENRDLVKEIETIRTSYQMISNEINELSTKMAVNENEIKNHEREYEQHQLLYPSLCEKEEILKECVLEDAKLGLIVERSLSDEQILMHVDSYIENIPENHRTKDSTEMLSRLHEVFQKHASGFNNNGITIEEQFSSSKVVNALRARSIITASFNYEKIGLLEYEKEIKKQIEDTCLLIQEKDRELFESILTDTVSNKLTNLISESKKWIADMSSLMSEMNSSMGLSFTLKWQPRKAENESMLSTDHLVRILSSDANIMSEETKESVTKHFKAEMNRCKLEAKDNEEPIDYRKIIKEILDYRKWYELRMYYQRKNEVNKELTDRAFNTFSGGEKAMAMYVPLFAAINSQYHNSKKDDYPRIIALDEAFAGVDDQNINEMFRLVEDLGFDYIMNSQALWGCYPAVKDLTIAELLRPGNDKFITVIFYHWDGVRRLYDR